MLFVLSPRCNPAGERVNLGGAQNSVALSIKLPLGTARYLQPPLAAALAEHDYERFLMLRAGKLEATSKGQVLESALSLEARNTFTNNNLFRQASFRPKVGLEFTNIVDAADHFKEVFGKEVSEVHAEAAGGTGNESPLALELLLHGENLLI